MRATFRTFGYGIPPERLDAMRKSLVQHPPELQTEQESLAYFRGFMAGAKRTQDESERFERLKDLCHRIASERKFKLYEDGISVAYEGLLAFLRRRRAFESPAGERQAAAEAIRRAILDGLRAEGPRTRAGATRYTTDTVSQHADSDGSTSYLDPASQDSAGDDFDFLHDLGALELPPRSQRILELLGAGYKLREVGEAVGLTQSRVCQIVKDLARTHPELEKFLLERVA
jgi:RNA polymerase sigma factor (sigma-70 family)